MRYLILIIIGIFLTACSLGPVKTAPITTYTLNASISHNQQHVKTAQQVLLVAPTLAGPGYQTSDMLYTQRPFELRRFAQNRWTAPPAEMLSPLLVQFLQSTHCFHAVVSPPFTGNSDLILDTQLLNLQQEFKKDSSQVRLVLQLVLSSNTTRQVLANQRVEAVIPAGDNPYSGVIAANKAAEEVLKKVGQVVCQSSSRP